MVEETESYHKLTQINHTVRAKNDHEYTVRDNPLGFLAKNGKVGGGGLMKVSHMVNDHLRILKIL